MPVHLFISIELSTRNAAGEVTVYKKEIRKKKKGSKALLTKIKIFRGLKEVTSPLLSTRLEATPRVLCPVLSPLVKEKN